jgi:hypothetical protein
MRIKKKKVRTAHPTSTEPWIDPIVEEVRRAREEYVASFSYDLDAIVRDLKEREGKSGRKVVSLQPKRLAVKKE